MAIEAFSFFRREFAGSRTISLLLGFVLAFALAPIDCNAQESAADLPAPARGVTVAGNLAYVAAGGQGLIILDISNPLLPQRIGGCKTGGEAWAVTATNGYAFVANGAAGMAIIDISAPTNAVIVGTFPTPLGCVVSIALSGRYACLADVLVGMRVVDISQPARPVQVGIYQHEKLTSLTASSQYIYAAEALVGVYVLDISDPTAPGLVGSYGQFRTDMAQGVAVVGDRLYAALDHEGLAVLDLTSPAKPVWKGQSPIGGFANAVTVANGYAFVCCGLSGFSIVDVRNASAPRPLSDFPTPTPGSASGVAISGSFALVADGWAGVQIFDIADLTRPVWVSGYHTGFERRAVTVSTNVLYAASGASGFQILSAEGDTRARLLGEFPTAGHVKAIAVKGRFAFLAEGIAGVQALDISDPNNVLPIAVIRSGGEANDLAISSNRLYVANGPAGFAAYDISSLQSAAPGPNPPGIEVKKVASLPTIGSINGITLAGTVAFLAAGKEGVIVADLSNPAAPRVLGRYDTSGDARAVALSGQYAFVADGWAGVEMIDVSDPANPRRVGGYETGGFAVGIAARERQVFLADSVALRTLDFSAPTAPTVRAEYSDIPALGVYTRSGRVYSITSSNSVATIDADPALTLTPLGDGKSLTGVRLTGAPGMSIQVQSSTNLHDWNEETTIVLEQNTAEIAITAMTEKTQFYRAFGDPIPPTANPEVPQIVLDSDIGSDGDDIGDTVLLHKFADMGLCNIVGMTFSLDQPWGAPALQAINTFYGRPTIPVATTKNSRVTEPDYLDQFVVEHFPNTMRSGANAENSVRFYREILAKAAPRSLTIIEASNPLSLVDTMHSGPDDLSPLTGEELLNQKVKLLAVIAGDYPSGTEFYFRFVPFLWVELVNRLKCPILYTGDKIGYYIRTAHRTQLAQLVPATSIMRAAYEYYYGFTGAPAREAWSQPLIWYLIVGPSAAGQKLFELERGGYNFVDDAGGNGWRTDKIGKSQGYLSLVARDSDIQAALTSIMYLPPGVLPRPFDPHVNLYAQLVQSNGGTVSDSTLQALDEYVKTLKSDGTWDRKSIIWPCAGDNLKAALCLLKHPLTTSGILRPIGTLPGSFVESEGLIGNGKFALDTGISALQIGLRTDSSHLAVYSLTDVSGTGLVECGRYQGGDAALELMIKYGAGYNFPLFDSGSVDPAQGRVSASQTVPTTGYFVGNRSSVSESVLYRNQTLVGSAHATGGVIPGPSLLIFSGNDAVTNSVRTLCHFSCGPHLSPAQLVTDAIATEKLQRALHRSAVP